MPRKVLAAIEAPNDGVRHLRELLRFRAAAQVALRLGCDATAVRRWAKGDRTPGPAWRDRLSNVFGIPSRAWEEPPGDDELPTVPRPPSR